MQVQGVMSVHVLLGTAAGINGSNLKNSCVQNPCFCVQQQL